MEQQQQQEGWEQERVALECLPAQRCAASRPDRWASTKIQAVMASATTNPTAVSVPARSDSGPAAGPGRMALEPGNP